MEAETISIDVSGAPAHVRSAIWFAFKVMLAFIIAIVLTAPLTILDLQRTVSLSLDVKRLCIAAAFSIGLCCVFGLQVLFNRDDERKIQLAPYRVSLAQAKHRLFARLHRPWWSHPDFWAFVSLALAVAIPIVLVVNERAVVSLGGADDFGELRWNNTIPEGGGMLVGLALLLNAARLYKRAISLWAFSVPFLVWFVLLPGLLFLYVWGAMSIASLHSGPDDAPHVDRDVVFYLFGYFPAAVFGFASLWPPVRRLYARMHNRFLRIMEVVQLPSAKQALARDKRQPVLYLRSFQVDQTWVWDGNTGKSAAPRRLEESVTAPLRELGPFVGIGKPGELAVTGAARSYFPNDEWQAAVADLMARASFIVVVIGATESLGWEVATIRAQRHTGKVIWIVPPDQTNAALLRAKLRDAFFDTPYENAARGADFSRALAVHTIGGAQLAVISSTRNTTGEYEAATYAAVYGLTHHLIGPARR